MLEYFIMKIHMRTFLTIVVTAIFSTACASLHDSPNNIPPKSESEPAVTVIKLSEVKWEQLNPARGTKSPMVGVLWGNRTSPGPSGFLVKFVDGFSSPPHIHNIAYRGVVISGTIHNDEPNSADMYMSVGSFWTQPEGGIHITAAKGSNTLAYIEVDDVFGVLPADQAFDSQDKVMNIDASDIVWVNLPGIIPSTDVPKVAYLWGNSEAGEPSGTLVKLPAGFSGTINSYGSELHAVMIQGQTIYSILGESVVNTMAPGSYFGSMGESVHQVSCEGGDDCVIYVRTEGEFDIVPIRLTN